MQKEQEKRKQSHSRMMMEEKRQQFRCCLVEVLSIFWGGVAFLSGCCRFVWELLFFGPGDRVRVAKDSDPLSIHWEIQFNSAVIKLFTREGGTATPGDCDMAVLGIHEY